MSTFDVPSTPLPGLAPWVRDRAEEQVADAAAVLQGVRCVVLGAGRVGTAYAALLQRAGARTVLLDPLEIDTERVLRALHTRLVVVATPPRVALPVARRAAAAAGVVLVAHPAALSSAEIGSEGERNIFVAFEAHADPAAVDLLAERPRVARAQLRIVRPHPGFLTGWRASRDSGGGLGHQVLLPPLALLERLLAPHPAPSVVQAVVRPRADAVETALTARAWLGDSHVRMSVQTQGHDVVPLVRLDMHTAEGVDIALSGRSWTAGIGDRAQVQHQARLRTLLCAAAVRAYRGGFAELDPALVPLDGLRVPLRLVSDLYRQASQQQDTGSDVDD